MIYLWFIVLSFITHTIVKDRREYQEWLNSPESLIVDEDHYELVAN